MFFSMMRPLQGSDQGINGGLLPHRTARREENWRRVFARPNAVQPGRTPHVNLRKNALDGVEDFGAGSVDSASVGGGGGGHKKGAFKKLRKPTA
jgi:hypothetical protein